MSTMRNHLPLLEDQHGGICVLDTGWLLAAVDRAAVNAGFFEWWLADHVTLSVCSYLKSFYTRNVVGLGRLQEVIRQALRAIGYGEIARCFHAELPASQVSLLQCAHAAGTMKSEDFFRHVADRVDEMHRSSLMYLHFYDLHPALAHMNRDAVADEALRPREIAEFIRFKIESLSWDRPLNCSIH